MIAFWIIFVWFVYVGVNIGLAEWNNLIRVERIKAGNKKQIEHFWWGLFYGALCAPMYWPGGVWFVGSVLLLHISVFPVFFNRASDLPAFHLSKTSTAITDRIMVWLGLTSTEWVNIGAFILSIGLLIKTIYG